MCNSCAFLPLLVAVWNLSTFLITFAIGVSIGHLYFCFSYISDAGVLEPERSIFSQMLNIGAVLGLLLFYVRYIQVREICERHNLENHVRNLSLVCWFLGILNTSTSSMVANFPEYQMSKVHVFSACSSFFSAFLWLILQTFLSFKLYPITGSMCINYMRLFLSIICSISAVGCAITTHLAFKYYNGNNPLKWNPEDGGYIEHIVSVVLEWTFVCGNLVYYSSYFSEMKNVILKEPVIMINYNDTYTQR